MLFNNSLTICDQNNVFLEDNIILLQFGINYVMGFSVILDYIPSHDYESCIMWHIQ